MIVYCGHRNDLSFDKTAVKAGVTTSTLNDVDSMRQGVLMPKSFVPNGSAYFNIVRRRIAYTSLW